MTQATEPCPALSDGTERQCWKCYTDIPIGSPAGKNQYGVFHHAACPPRTDSKTAAALAAPRSAPVTESAPEPAPLDLIDKLALAMDGETAKQASPPRPDLDLIDQTALAMEGLPPLPQPPSSTLASMDLVDRMAAALDDELPEPPVPAAAVRDAALRASFGPLLDAWEKRGVTPPQIAAQLAKLPTSSHAQQPTQQLVDLIDATAEAMDV